MAAASSSSASSSDAMKTLTVGPSRGNISALVSKTKAIEAKHGPFDALFVTGDFFSSGEELNEDEQNLLDGKLSTPIRTYVAYGRTRPPKRVRDLVAAAAGGQQATTSNGDRLPVKLAEKLYWLGRDQVTWVAKDQADEDAIRRAARAPKAGDDEGVIVDEEAERRGLRVGVCGGSWNAEAWAKEIQGGAAAADGEADKTEENNIDEESPYILPSTINRLNSHKAFQPLAPPAPPSSAPAVQHQTLAAARQATQALIAAAASASRSSSSSRPHLDILLLPSWPSGISLFSKTFPPTGLTEEARTWGLPALAELARRSCPRYIFAPPAIEAGEETDGVFWEREPYTTSMTAIAPAAAGRQSAATGANSAMPRPAPADTRTTRFISLAKAANASKARWFVALNLAFAGSAAATAAPPKGATMSPFGPPPVATSANKRKAGDDVDEDQGLNSAVNFRWQQRGGRGGGNAKRPRNGHDSSAGAGHDDAHPPPGYTCRICGSSDHYIRLCPHSAQQSASRSGLPSKPEGAEAALEPLQLGRRKREPVTMVGPADCWFCLSNPQCAKHLVVSIAEGLYVALPKGQLPPATPSSGGVPGGGHVLLVPITHAATYAGNSEAARSLRDEMEAHLECLEKMYASYGCGLAAWCVVKLANTRAGHLQVQCVPVPPRKEEGDLLEYVKGQAEERGYELKRVEPDVAPLPAAAWQTEEGGSTRRRRLAAHPSSDEEFFELHISTPSPSTTTSEAPRRTTLLLDLSRPTTGGPPIRFDYQFARTTLAQYLGVPDRADWRACCEGGQEMEAEQTREVRRLWGEWGPQDEADDSDDDDEDEE